MAKGKALRLLERRRDRVAEVACNARTTWQAMLLLLAFATIALGGIGDIDLLLPGVQATLPLVGVAVPVLPFFWVTPALCLLLYAYFQIYLLTLGRAVAALDEAFGALPATQRAEGEALPDHGYPWLFTDLLLGSRGHDRAIPFWSTLVIVLTALGSFLAPTVIGIFWWRSFPLHRWELTVWIGLLLVTAIYCMLRTLPLLATRGEGHPGGMGWKALKVAVPLGLVLLIVGALKSTGPLHGLGPLNLARADIRLGELVERPEGWRSEPDAYRSHIATWFGLPPTALTDKHRDDTAALGAFDAARDSAFQWLNRLILSGYDLRGLEADLVFAPRMEFIRADLSHASFQLAMLERAVFREARLVGTDFDAASLQHANFDGADLRGATFEASALSDASFDPTTLRGARRPTDLRGANFDKADLSGLDLTNAKTAMIFAHGADFRRTIVTQEQLCAMKGNAHTKTADGSCIPSCYRESVYNREIAEIASLWLSKRPDEPGFRARYKCGDENVLTWHGNPGCARYGAAAVPTACRSE